MSSDDRDWEDDGKQICWRTESRTSFTAQASNRQVRVKRADVLANSDLRLSKNFFVFLSRAPRPISLKLRKRYYR